MMTGRYGMRVMMTGRDNTVYVDVFYIDVLLTCSMLTCFLLTCCVLTVPTRAGLCVDENRAM